MASGYTVNGVDLDQLFADRGAAAKTPATGYTVAGVDINDRYKPYVSGPKADPTGYSVGSTDLCDIFQSASSGPVTLPVNGKQARADELLANQQSGQAYAEFVARPDGTYELHTYAEPNGGGAVVATGTWNTLGGAASGYDVLFSLVDINYPAGTDTGTTTQNAAPTYTAMTANRAAQVKVTGAFNSGTHAITATLHISFRRKSDGYVFAVASVYLSAHIDGSV